VVLETLRRVYPELTPAQQVLADYVARSYREVAFMTAARVAEAVAMNEATVIRFAQRLGFEGYPDMQEAIQAAVLAELEGPRPPTQPRGLMEVFGASLVRSSERTRSMATRISADALERAVAMLVTASDVLVLGDGEGATLGEHLVRQLRGLDMRVQQVSADAGDLAHALASVRPGDVVIGCGGTDGNTLVAAAIEASKTLGARTLALSHTPLAPEAQVAEVAMAPAPSDERILPGLANLAALVDALTQALVVALPDAQERIARIFTVRQQLEQLQGSLESRQQGRGAKST
jgi:DNA-binding MurR/RpiR family transcriptional regulator